MKKTTFNCDNCGESKTINSSKFNKDAKKHFCSNTCKFEYQKQNSLINKNIKCYCDNCGKEITIILSRYTNNKNHFCSNECKNIFNSNFYNCRDGFAKCNTCNIKKPISEFIIQKRSGDKFSCFSCKVCEYKTRNGILSAVDGWSIEEYDIILDNILNKKVDFINDIIDKLNNKNLEDLCKLLKDILKIGGRTKIRIKQQCTYCGKNIGVKLYQYFDDQLHFCSAKCNTKYYGEIKSLNTEKHLRICQNADCKKEFWVDSSRVNAGKDKYCSPVCSQKSQIVKIETKCSFCGEKLEVTPFIYENQKNHFCDINCSRSFYIGENSSTWKGGITDINIYLRNQLTCWKEDSKKYYNNKCLLTNIESDIIHHLYSFHFIVDETFNNTHIEKRSNIGDYTELELLTLKEECIKLHYKYGLGVCLSEDMHILFHDIYGRGNNTPEQFKEFETRFHLGDFKYII